MHALYKALQDAVAHIYALYEALQEAVAYTHMPYIRLYKILHNYQAANTTLIHSVNYAISL